MLVNVCLSCTPQVHAPTWVSPCRSGGPLSVATSPQITCLGASLEESYRGCCRPLRHPMRLRRLIMMVPTSMDPC